MKSADHTGRIIVGITQEESYRVAWFELIRLECI